MLTYIRSQPKSFSFQSAPIKLKHSTPKCISNIVPHFPKITDVILNGNTISNVSSVIHILISFLMSKPTPLFTPLCLYIIGQDFQGHNKNKYIQQLQFLIITFLAKVSNCLFWTTSTRTSKCFRNTWKLVYFLIKTHSAIGACNKGGRGRCWRRFLTREDLQRAELIHPQHEAKEACRITWLHWRAPTLCFHSSSAVNLRDLTQTNASGNPTKSGDLTTLCSSSSFFWHPPEGCQRAAAQLQGYRAWE